MNHSERDLLLKEILGGKELSDFRQASLSRTLIEVRRRQRRRRAVNASAFLGLMLLISVVALNWVRNSLQTASSYFPSGQTAKVKFITDEELFALFPNRPLALIGPPGQQQLVFLDQLTHDAQ